MKTLKLAFTLSLLALSPSAFAQECVDEKGNDITNQPEVFIALIQKSESCYQAQRLAEACAWGSSLDVQTAGAAYVVCSEELEKQNPNRSLITLLETMQGVCTKKYEQEQGSMYRSLNAYCHLSAMGWILGIAIPN